MTSTPLLSSDSIPSLTAKVRNLALQSPIKVAHESCDLRLDLAKVIGTTTSSSTGFDCLSHSSAFALCAGSAAIVNHVDEDSKISQKIFRARPNGTSLQQGSSSGELSTGANTPEHRKAGKSLRSSIYTPRAVGSPSSEYGGSPGKIAARQRTRAVTCVALSSDGKMIALGEVRGQ
jgi:hypothetical protein